MKELSEKWYELKKRIKENNDDIEEIETALYYPRNQVVTDMPRGGGSRGNTVDRLLAKLERLKAEREMLKSEHYVLWNKILEKLNICGASEDVKKLFELRFYHFKQWKECVPLMTKFSGEEWNENRVYREYRSICEKCTQIQV